MPPGPAAGPADTDILAAIVRSRPLLEDVLSLWPPEMRRHLVLWIDVAGAEVGVKARLRSAPVGADDGQVADQVDRVKGDVAIVFELAGKAPVVVPLRSVRRAA